MNRPALLLLPLLLVPGCTTGPEPTPPTGTTSPNPDPSLPRLNATWTTHPALPEPRTEVACATDGTKIYVLGGFQSGNVVSARLDIYDTNTKTWARGRDSPLPLHHTGLAFHQGSLYALGGYTGFPSFQGSNLVLRYQPDQDLWTTDGALTARRGAHAVLLHGANAYLVGGAPQQPGAETYATTEIYNLTAKTTMAGPALAASKEHLAGAQANGTLVASGGRRMSLSNFNTTETLRPGGTWQIATPLPTARGGIAAAAWQNLVIVFGGEAPGRTFAEAEAYDVDLNAWTVLPVMPSSRHGLCAATIGDQVHVIGGGPQAGLSVGGAHEVLTLTRTAP